MRIAVAQILSGTDPADNLQLVQDYSGWAAESGASLVVFPEATMCRFGVPLAPIAEPVAGPWADGVRRIAADAGITGGAGPPPRRRAGPQHVVGRGSRGLRHRRPLRQDPPLRRLRVHRVDHGRTWARARRGRRRRRRGWADHLLRPPL